MACPLLAAGRRVALRSVFLLWSCGVLASVAAAQSVPPSWFKVTAEQARGWAMEAAENGRWVIIRPDWRSDASGASSGAVGAEPKKTETRIMALYSSPSSAYDTALAEILHVFRERQTPAMFMAINTDNNASWTQEAVQLAERLDFHLIFGVGSGVAAQLHKKYRGGRLPVVTVCAKDPVLMGQVPDYTSGGGANFAFTSLNVPIEVQFAYLLMLKPNLRIIAALYSQENASVIQTQLRPLVSYAQQRNVEVIEVGAHDASAAADLTRLVPAAAARMQERDPERKNSIFWVTGSTTVFQEIATINRHAGMIPVVSAAPDVVRAGDDSAVLSIGVGFAANAQVAARYGLDILSGRARPGALPVGMVTPPDIAVNFRRARAIGLKIPFAFVESADTIYDLNGAAARLNGDTVAPAAVAVAR